MIRKTAYPVFSNRLRALPGSSRGRFFYSSFSLRSVVVHGAGVFHARMWRRPNRDTLGKYEIGTRPLRVHLPGRRSQHGRYEIRPANSVHDTNEPILLFSPYPAAAVATGWGKAPQSAGLTPRRDEDFLTVFDMNPACRASGVEPYAYSRHANGTSDSHAGMGERPCGLSRPM